MTFIQTDTYTIHSYECDATGRLSVPALMNLMQESANRNAADYGIDSLTLQNRGFGWMLMRFGLTVHQYPRNGQTIQVVTYPTAVEKFFIYRDFQLLADDGTRLADATSTWLVFDTTRRTMVPLPGFIRSLTPPDRSPVLPNLPTKPAYQTVDFSDVPTSEVTVGWFDIDSNQHVNNVVYIRWLLEQADETVLQTQELARLDVVYRSETYWREQIRVQYQPTGADTLVHRLSHAETGKDVLLAQTHWR